MAVTIKHINDDASFLLSFTPDSNDVRTISKAEPFHILLDPWITGPSMILHEKISISHHRNPACISSLAELPEPNLVIISQHITDHCNEATLRQLPPTGTKTIILAEPASARIIRSWRYFDKDKVVTIPRWDDSKIPGPDAVVKIAVQPNVDGMEAGEVTVAFIPQKKDISGLFSAVGITYRAPSTSPPVQDGSRTPTSPAWLSPPPSPRPRKSFTNLSNIFSSTVRTGPGEPSLSPPTPTSPGVFSLRSVRSASSIPLSTSSTLTAATTLTAVSSCPPTSPAALSILFSPHGISYPSLEGYASSHFSSQSALPLTVLLHCFHAVTNPWWLGGPVLLGAPAGTETAGRLHARVWIGAHDGDKEVGGLGTALLRTRRWEVEDVVRELRGGKGEGEKGGWEGTEVVELGIGEEVVVTRAGMGRGGEEGKAPVLPVLPVLENAGWLDDKRALRVGAAEVVVTAPG